MKRKLLYVAAALAVVAVVAFIYRDYIRWAVILVVIKPGRDFEEIGAPPAPDYSRAEHWAALPDRYDDADVLPAGDAVDNQAVAEVDVFFLHPTTYYSRANWNQPLDDKGANDKTDKRALRHQASAFNGSARVYAPRYRQATLYSFRDKEGNGEKALDLAYADVKSAFEYYLGNYNEGRPIIVASHSQGSRHGQRLLAEFFADEPLRSQLIAAYLVGWPGSPSKDGSDIAGIPVCDSPDQTECWLTWNTIGPDAVRYGGRDAVCVNPLTWKTDGEYAASELNIGGVVFPEEGDERPAPDVGIVCAECIDGALVISKPEGDGYSNMSMGRDNYHIYDYTLFYMNVRKNVAERVAAYLSRSPAEAAE